MFLSIIIAFNMAIPSGILKIKPEEEIRISLIWKYTEGQKNTLVSALLNIVLKPSSRLGAKEWIKPLKGALKN